MGLAVEVGILTDLMENDEEGYEYFKDQFAKLNTYLNHIGMPNHQEPEEGEIWSGAMFGYSGLHCLRRLAAHLDATGRLPTKPGDLRAADDPILQRYYESASGSSFDHLIQHSDAEGFYLPIEFAEVLYPDETLEIAGGIIGSSSRLLTECQRIAQILGIPSELDETSEELRNAADAQGESDILWKQYGIESFTCVCLIRACQKSLELGAAIVFC